ncbi:MAG: acetyl/propionyl/methylcrotonyl-CoA carboxylase subunit alpha [Acidobacteriota bacterium]
MRKLVIANRGEIARRVLRAGRERGYRVAVISTLDDRDALVRQEADAVLEVKSFLDREAIVFAARDWGADLLHPGYGFLAESAAFADEVERSGVVFVGPTAENIRALGHKESAKALARKRKVPTLPALLSHELKDVSAQGLEKTLGERGIRPPYLIKAAGGGGGRGMRIVQSPAELAAGLRRASEEAESGFGDPDVFVEHYLDKPRHIEIQVFGDGEGGGVFLGERECSMQRRHQKVVEEAPSAVVDRNLREAMGRAALALVTAVGYRSAGTVEFLLDEDKNFYFLEMNTRLQVEHPVTEMVYGIDLVDAQLDLAEGAWPGELGDGKAIHVPEPEGVAIEARILAEDPRHDFLPTPGPLVAYREPVGEGIRVDSGVAEGGRVNARFDSMIAKVIAWGADRSEALDRLSRALENMVVHGCTTNLPFLQSLVRHPDFRSGRESTAWIAENLKDLNDCLLPPSLVERLSTPRFREKLSLELSGGAAPFAVFAERFLAQGNAMARVGSELEWGAVEIQPGDRRGEIWLSGPGLAAALRQGDLDSFRFSDSLRQAAGGGPSISVTATASRISVSKMALTLFGETLVLECPRHAARAGLDVSTGDGEVRAPMAGKVLEVWVQKGDAVEEGQVVFVIESMKMQLEVKSPATGRVRRVHVKPGQVLAGPDVMAILE